MIQKAWKLYILKPIKFNLIKFKDNICKQLIIRDSLAIFKR